MKRALIVNPFWDTLGGGERYTATFAKMLLDHGWSVEILWPENLSNSLCGRFGIDLTKANWVNKTFTFTFTFNYDLLFWVSDGSLPTSFLKMTIIHLQFPFAGVGGRSLPNILKSRFYKFVVNSNFTKSFIDQEFGVNSEIIYPPVEVSEYKSVKKLDRILYVGRFSDLTQRKGQDVLIRVFSKISKKLSGWKLVLAGGTRVGLNREDFAKLQKSSVGYPIEFVTDPNLTTIKNLYAQSKIFWSAGGFGVDEKTNPTLVEHFGITVVEAMAAACVPIITNLGGHKEIVTQGVDGFLYNSVSELGDYTLQLAANNDLLSQLSQSAAAKSKMFSIDKFYEKAWHLVDSRIGT